MRNIYYLSCQPPPKQAGCCFKGHVKSFEGPTQTAVIKPQLIQRNQISIISLFIVTKSITMSSYVEGLFQAKYSHSCSSVSSGKRAWLLNVLPRCRIRRLLLILSFLDTLCTRVGISQGYNQGMQSSIICWTFYV